MTVALFNRPYQDECLKVISQAGPGRWLIQMATGTGKTFTFSQIHAKRTLILSHREELVKQPAKYYSCPVGFEQGKLTSNGEQVISASVQTLKNRLNKFRPDDFDLIITDEAHHAAAKTYQTIYDYFKPETHLGFTATPSRGDGQGLDHVFDEIIYTYDIKQGISQGHLAPLHCLRADIGYDLSGVASRLGDYAIGELEKAVNIEGANKAIAEAYHRYAEGPTIIFAVNLEHARAIAEQIPGAMWVKGGERKEIKYPLVNCMVYTEGVDLPEIQTVIIARPTRSQTLYSQMVGRGLRLNGHRCVLIDCVGVSNNPICTAPSLIGLTDEQIPERFRHELEGDLLADLPELIQKKSDCPESWIKNAYIVDLWTNENHLNLHGVEWFQLPDRSLYLSLGNAPGLREGWRGKKRWVKITCPDHLNRSRLETWTGYAGNLKPTQDIIDEATKILINKYKDVEYLWNAKKIQSWASKPASQSQLNYIEKRGIKFNGYMSKGAACKIITRLKAVS